MNADMKLIKEYMEDVSREEQSKIFELIDAGDMDELYDVTMSLVHPDYDACEQLFTQLALYVKEVNGKLSSYRSWAVMDPENAEKLTVKLSKGKVAGLEFDSSAYSNFALFSLEDAINIMRDMPANSTNFIFRCFEDNFARMISFENIPFKSSTYTVYVP